MVNATLYEVAFQIGTVMEELKEKVKTLRNILGWSQEDLARHIDVSLSTVQRWEMKKVKPNKLAQRELNKLFKKASKVA